MGQYTHLCLVHEPNDPIYGAFSTFVVGVIVVWNPGKVHYALSLFHLPISSSQLFAHMPRWMCFLVVFKYNSPAVNTANHEGHFKRNICWSTKTLVSHMCLRVTVKAMGHLKWFLIEQRCLKGWMR